MTDGFVVLVDEHDREIGVANVLDAHRGSGQLHRAVSVFLFRDHNGTIELLMQRRSHKKIVGDLQWANTVCGNVRPQETYEQCAARRLFQELSIGPVKITPVYKFRYQVQCNPEFSENEIDQVFFGWYEGPVRPDPDEVSEYEWVEWNTLKQRHTFGDLDDTAIAPWFAVMMNDRDLIDKMDRALA